MGFHRRQVKLDARQSMRFHRPSVYLVTLVFLLIGYILTLLSSRIMHPGLDTKALENEIVEYFYAQYSPDMDEAETQRLMDTITLRTMESLMRQLDVRPGLIGYLLITAIYVMDLMISIGYIAFCLDSARNAESGFGTLFDAFGNFFRLLWLCILTGIFVFLWSLLLVVPGIIASYRYSMAIFIMLDDPDKSALQCIRESKEMTRGHKGQLFVLDLSFLGWVLLSMIPFVSIFTTPYITIAHANCYRALSGRPEAPAHVDYSV